ncbi:MAG: YkgJ family cysteine cluster protein [Chitinophagaceae bacterium]|nr:YkgJ family cysteine cluster protein [Chitinophagaceae bacterium]
MSRPSRKVNIRSFKQKVRHHKKELRGFLNKIAKNPPRHLDRLAEELDQEVWKHIDCLTCANCCKTMSPTYTAKDIKRIAAHLGMKEKAFKEKWLYLDKKDGDWMNRQTPCQFLDLKTNKCTIYPVRPADCAGFPHLTKKKMTDYIHVHKQNIAYCPATYKMVEMMQARLVKDKHPQ